MFGGQGPVDVPPTPHMDLCDMFDGVEDDGGLGTAVDPADERQNIDAGKRRTSTTRAHGTRALKSESQYPAPAPKTTTRTRRAPTSAGKQSSRKKDVLAIEVPLAVVDEQASGKEAIEDQAEDVESKPPVANRRANKRAAKKAAMPTPGEVVSAGDGLGRGSRSTRRVATSKGLVEHKTTKMRAAHSYSEDEKATHCERKTWGERGSKRTAKKQQVCETDSEAEQEPSGVSSDATTFVCRLIIITVVRLP